jgi:Tfp pilus assembly protein PilP/Tfp pilus assembly protein PilO
MMLHSFKRHPALWPPYARYTLLSAGVLCLALVFMLLGTAGLPAHDGLKQPASTKPVHSAQDLQALNVQRTALTQALAQHAQRWPEQRLPQVLQDIQRTARQHGLHLDVFKPMPVRMGAEHAELPVHIKLQATHEALMNFLRDVSQLARPISVSDLHLQAGADKQLTLEAQLLVLRLLSEQEKAQRKTSKPHPPAANTAAQTTSAPMALVANLATPSEPPLHQHLINPFDPQRLNDWLRAQQPLHEPAWLAAERGRNPQWLERFALDQLQLVGQLMQDGQRVALIKVAQRIHPVRVGHYLGPHEGRVLSIDEQALTLREIFQDETGQWQQRRVVLKLERAS